LGTSSISQVQKLLNGTANITADTVVKIAQAIGKKPHVVWE
jgi:plasmid maintenance system antidote protein VapI